jgi:hypothetical protein
VNESPEKIKYTRKKKNSGVWRARFQKKKILAFFFLAF